MKHNFDEYINRQNTGSVKWSAEDVLPMWVADMDFKTVPAVTEALTRRAAQGIFGYTQTPDSFYEAIANWWHKRHGLSLKKDWIIPSPGVMPALAAAVEALTAPGDKIIIQPPVYNHFFITVSQSHCELLKNALRNDDGRYSIDFDDLERKAADPKAKLLLLSNPHNPAGRVWTVEELQRIGDICIANNVIVLSDEIHSDLLYGDFRHIPFASLGEAYAKHSITFSSPTKTFNIAGILVAYLFTENEEYRAAVKRTLTKWEMTMLNIFAIESLTAAYQEGETWLEELKKYLYDNYLYLANFCRTHLPDIRVIPLQATYLVWLDCSVLGLPSQDMVDSLIAEERLWLQPGIKFGQAGDKFLRMNIACPRELLEEGLRRLEQGYRRMLKH